MDPLQLSPPHQGAKLSLTAMDFGSVKLRTVDFSTVDFSVIDFGTLNSVYTAVAQAVTASFTAIASCTTNCATALLGTLPGKLCVAAFSCFFLALILVVFMARGNRPPFTWTA